MFGLFRSIVFVYGFLLLWSVSVFAQPPFVPNPPSIRGSAYALMEADTQTLIVQHEVDQRLPPASLTKIMTSYVIANELHSGRLHLDDQVDISVNAWKKGGSKMFVREGTQVVLSDLLKGIVIQSGNDASIAVAEHIAGSEEAFADLMNLHAKELGMQDSHFLNATGWPMEGHYTTVRDLLTLSQALIHRFPDHYAIYQQKSFTYNGISQNNRNNLLFSDASVDGVKTGHTQAAGYCLVASAKKDGMRLISVVMGADSARTRNNESRELLKYGFRFFEKVSLVEPHTVLAVSPVWMGSDSQVTLGLVDRVIKTLPKGHLAAVKQQIELAEVIKAPIEVGQPLGTIRFELNGEVIAESPLVALAAVESGGIFKRAWHYVYLMALHLFS